MVFCGLSAHVEGCRVAADTRSPSGTLGCRSPLPTGEASTFRLQGERCFLPHLQGVTVDAEGGWHTLQTCLKMLHQQTRGLATLGRRTAALKFGELVLVP